MARLSTLAVSVASGKVGYAFFVGRELTDWGIAQQMAKSSNVLVGYVQELINQLKPDVFVSLRPDTTARKANHTRALIRSIENLGDQNYVLNVSIDRPKPYESSFEEATAITSRYPELMGYKPARRRRIFDPELKGTVLFEAVLLAEHVIFGGPEPLAAAMG